MMKQHTTLLRPAGAAIAAVLACSTLSAAPIMAQGVARPAATASPPVIEVAPAQPPVMASDRPSPIPDVLRVPALPPMPSAPVISIEPGVASPETVAGEPASAPRRATATAALVAPRGQAAPTRSSQPLSRTGPVAAQGVLPVADVVPPISAAEVVPDNAFSKPVATTGESVSQDASSASEGPNTGEWAIILGLVGLGGVAATAAFTRRRRSTPEDNPQITVDYERSDGSLPPPEMQARSLNGYLSTASSRPVATPLSPAATPLAAPQLFSLGQRVAMHRAPGPVSVPAASTSSRTLGHHEAMVDFGPTPGNPFLTRRKRLIRARFLDRQDALAGSDQGVQGQMQRRFGSMR